MLSQTRREELIKVLDKDESEVNIEDLFLYDLSPYYEEKIDDSLFYKQLEFIQEKNRLNHNSTFSFAPEQKRIYDELSEYERLVISAPTSFGKTMLVKEYIFTNQPDVVAFIVPTNSLADELIVDFDKLYSELGYVVFDSIRREGSIPPKSIFIGTQEKFYQILPYYTVKIDLFVIDEAYKLSDAVKGSREVLLNRTFIDALAVAKKVILLLPLVNEIYGLNSFEILKSDYSPVAKNFKALSQLDEILLSKILERKESNLVYFNSPNDVDSFFLGKIRPHDNIKDQSSRWIQRVSADFHPEWLPVLALKKSVGIHYGPMPKFVQKKVIDLFNQNEIKTLLATSSVIEGVNTPTKNIYITTSQNILGGNNLIKFKNLIGRAGRLGMHKVGNVFYHSKDRDRFEEANRPYHDITLEFIVNDESEVVQINRELEFGRMIINENIDIDNLQTHEILEDKIFGLIPKTEIRTLLDRHGFKIQQLVNLLHYLKEDKTTFFGVVWNLEYRETKLNCINTILTPKYKTVQQILEKLKLEKDFKEMTTTTLISLIIKMIYSIIPYTIIPVINFILELDSLYNHYNKQPLLTRFVKQEANKKKKLFILKFIGREDGTRIMTKLFEYGIPYHRAKKHLPKISGKIPATFSILDIKKVIMEDESMSDLKIYFE